MDFKLQFVKTLDTTPESIFYSLIKYKNDILGFARRSYKEHVIKQVKFNNDFDIIEDNNLTLIGEDPRVFIFNNDLYIQDNKNNKMFLIDYNNKKYIKLNISGKNITFFEHNNTLYYIHYIKPFSLYSFNIKTGISTKIDVNDDLNSYNYEYRGGTPGYKLNNNEYYGIGHRTYIKNNIMTHDIFKWVVSFEENKLPKISIINIEQPLNSKNICDPTSIIEINNQKYLITAETEKPWFHKQKYLNNIYLILN